MSIEENFMVCVLLVERLAVYLGETPRLGVSNKPYTTQLSPLRGAPILAYRLHRMIGWTMDMVPAYVDCTVTRLSGLS
jgi:hypothetical protein